MNLNLRTSFCRLWSRAHRRFRRRHRPVVGHHHQWHLHDAANEAFWHRFWAARIRYATARSPRPVRKAPSWATRSTKFVNFNLNASIKESLQPERPTKIVETAIQTYFFNCYPNTHTKWHPTRLFSRCCRRPRPRPRTSRWAAGGDRSVAGPRPQCHQLPPALPTRWTTDHCPIHRAAMAGDLPDRALPSPCSTPSSDRRRCSWRRSRARPAPRWTAWPFCSSGTANRRLARIWAPTANRWVTRWPRITIVRIPSSLSVSYCLCSAKIVSRISYNCKWNVNLLIIDPW